MKSSRRSFLLNPLSMLLAGLLLGIAARLFDIYFQNLGEIFSQIAIWILLGTGFAIYSPTKKAAMENIFPFCMGMLAAYYVTAAITHFLTICAFTILSLTGCLIYILFFKKIKRSQKRKDWNE